MTVGNRAESINAPNPFSRFISRFGIGWFLVAKLAEGVCVLAVHLTVHNTLNYVAMTGA